MTNDNIQGFPNSFNKLREVREDIKKIKFILKELALILIILRKTKTLLGKRNDMHLVSCEIV